MTVIRSGVISGDLWGGLLLCFAFYLFALGIRFLIAYFQPLQYDDENIHFWKGIIPRKFTIPYKDIFMVRYYKTESKGYDGKTTSAYHWAVDSSREGEMLDVPFFKPSDGRTKELIDVIKAKNPSAEFLLVE